MSDESVQDFLRALADEDASVEAPPDVETRVRKQFQFRQRQRIRRRSAAWAASAAAVIALIFFGAIRKSAVEPVKVVVNTPATAVAKTPAPLILETATAPPRRPIVRPARQRLEIVTDFFPLMDPAPPFERGQLMRVELPASAMQMVGLPVHEDRLSERVQADVLLGEEGLPRAIRFVRIESK